MEKFLKFLTTCLALGMLPWVVACLLNVLVFPQSNWACMFSPGATTAIVAVHCLWCWWLFGVVHPYFTTED